MMNFLRKHQKKLFVVITVMIIASFCFFGTFSTMAAREIPDKKVAVAVDGSPIMERDLHAMIRFLSLGSHEVLKNDLMSTGLTAILAERYFDEFKDEFQERIEKARRFSTYIHPQAPFLSAAHVWSQFIPQLPVHLAEVQRGDLSPKTFAAYCDLYIDQVSFSPEILRRILLYQQQQFSWISPDMALSDVRHLALFGHQSFQEWFGPRFTEILGKFFFNASAIAEKKGYKVSTDEARASLLQTCLHTLKTIPSKQEVTFHDASELLRTQLQMAGIDETKAVKIWKKVMLVHRLFNEVGHGVLVDPLSYQQFLTFADETAAVEVYQLPENLRLADFRSLLKLDYYLEAITPKAKKLSELPRQFLTPEEAEKKAPELVVSRYVLQVAKATKEEVGARLTLKETWDFEASDEGWKKLQVEYPILTRTDAASREDRFAVLDALESDVRLKIDRSARCALIDQHPEWMEEALSKISSEKQTVAIRSRGAVAPFDKIEDTSSLRAFLQKAPMGEAAPLFTHDHQTYYRITVWEKPFAKEIMTFKEALAGDWLGDLLDQKLQDAYTDVRKKDPKIFKSNDDAWKPFFEVRDQVGALVYGEDLDQNPGDRLAALMQSARKNIEVQGEASPFLKTTGQPHLDQWALVKQTKEIKRSDATTLSGLFTAAEGEWSSVSVPKNGDLAFFRLIKKGFANPKIESPLSEGQRLLGMDAQRLLMHQILTQMENDGPR